MSALLDGTRIAKLRKQKGWDQQQLAATAQVDPSVISRLERGMQEDFKFSVVLSIASSLGVSVDSLLKKSTLSESEELIGELQSVLVELRHQPKEVQRLVAGMIRGFLTALKEQ